VDLGIKGKKAIVCASSKGLGRACAEALLKEGVNVIINSRNKSNLEKTFQELNKFADAKITMVQADLNTDEGKISLINCTSCIKRKYVVTRVVVAAKRNAK